MSQVVFFLTKLKSQSERDRYEQWVREKDVPVVDKMKSVRSYRVVRLDGPVMEDVARTTYDYIEIIEVDDVQQYQEEIKNIDPEMLGEFMGFIGEFEAVHGHSVER